MEEGWLAALLVWWWLLQHHWKITRRAFWQRKHNLSWGNELHYILLNRTCPWDRSALQIKCWLCYKILHIKRHFLHSLLKPLKPQIMPVLHKEAVNMVSFILISPTQNMKQVIGILSDRGSCPAITIFWGKVLFSWSTAKPSALRNLLRIVLLSQALFIFISCYTRMSEPSEWKLQQVGRSRWRDRSCTLMLVVNSCGGPPLQVRDFCYVARTKSVLSSGKLSIIFSIDASEWLTSYNLI